MNSTQLNFFINPSDWTKIVGFWDNQGIKQIDEQISKPQQIKLEDIKNPSEQMPKTMLLTIPTFRDHIFFDYDIADDKYSINRLKSYILEFSPGGFYQNNLNILHRGRFYCVKSYYASNGEQVVKSQEFSDWIRKVYSMFKKQFLIRMKGESMIWFSKNTLELMHEKNGIIDAPCLTIHFDNS